MPREFFTEQDIENLVQQGISSLVIGENTFLTPLASERASQLGLRLVDSTGDPSCSPVRPYLNQPAAAPARPPSPALPSAGPGSLEARIREAVMARMGDRVDPSLLDRVIQRVLSATGIR